MMQKTKSLSFLTGLLLFFSIFTNAQDCLQLELDNLSASQYDQLCLPVKVKNFQDIIGFQFSINWEGHQLNYADLIQLNEDLGISLSNFGTPSSGLDEGNLTISWTSPTLTPVSLPNSEVLFSVCLDVVGDGSLVTFGGSPAIVEIFGEDLEVLPVGMLNGKITVTEPTDLLKVDDICADSLTCQSPTTTISVSVVGGTPPYSFLWDGPNAYSASDQNPTVNDGGPYHLLVTDSEGYSASAEYHVMANLQDDFINDVIIQNPDCTVDNGSITLEMVGEVDDYSFVWNTGADSSSIEGLSEGDYAVTITDGNTSCAIEETYTVATESLISAFSYECEFLPDTTMATITSVIWSGGTSPYTFEWSNGDTQLVNMDFPVSSIYVGASETYSLTITDANGCSEVFTDIEADCGGSSDDVVFNVSSANADSYDQVCVDVSVNGFTNILEAQFSLNYDPVTLEYESVGNFGLPGLNESVMGLPGWGGSTNHGTVTVEWTDPDLGGVTVADSTVLFEICFQVQCTNKTDIEISGVPVPIHVIDANEDTLSTIQNVGKVNESNFNFCIVHDCYNMYDDSTNVGIGVVVWHGGLPPYTFEWENGYTTVDEYYVAIDTITISCQEVPYSLTITDATGLSDVLTNLGEHCDCGDSSDDVVFNVSSANVDLGDQVCVDVTVDNFTDILAAQFSIDYDASILEYASVGNFGLPGLNENVMGLSVGGTIVVAWTDPNLDGVTVADSTVLFEICFTTLASGTSTIAVTDTPTAIEVIDSGSNIVPTVQNDGTVTVNDGGGTDDFTFSISSETAINVGDQVCVDVTVDNFTDILGAQFSIDYDASILEYASVGNFGLPGLNENVMGLPGGGIDAGTIVVHWTDPTLSGLTVADSTVLFEICFTALAPGASPIAVTDTPITIQVVDTESNLIPVTIKIGFVTVFDGNGSNFITLSNCEQTDYMDSVVVDLSVSVWVGGTPPYTFEWSNGFTEVNEFNSTLTYTCPGTYSLTITDSDGNSEVLEDVTDNCDCDNYGNADVELSIDHGVGETGDQVCVSVRAEVFEDIIGMQYSLNYDPDVATLSTIEPKDLFALTTDNFAVVTAGVVTMVWIDPTISGVSLDAGTALYELCFDIAGDIGTSTELLFSSISTPIEFVNSTSDVVVLQGSHGSITVAENVWPGDTDNSELVTNVDLLNIGLGYGLTGPERPETGTDWQGYGALDWDQSTPQGNINYKNADANGDGIISALDANAILDNYGEDTNFWDGDEDQFVDQETNNLLSPPIFVLPDTIIPGSVVAFPIMMGSDNFPVDEIYGVAFTILYDPDVVVPESAFASFDTSWVGLIDDNMLGLYKDFHSQGEINVAITRTDGINVSGNGQIGTLHLTIEDIILRTSLYPVDFEIVDVKAIRYDEEPVIIAPRLTTMIIDVINSSNEIPLDELISIFPNPTNDHLFINTNEVDILEVAVHAIDGSLMPLDYNHSNALSLRGLPNGVYLLKIYTDKGILNSRIVKQGN